MARYKVIFEVTYTTDAECYEDAINTAYTDLVNGIIQVTDVKEMSYGTHSTG